MRELQAARQAHGGHVEAPPFTMDNASRRKHYRRRIQTKLEEFKMYLKRWKNKYGKIQAKAFQ